MTNDKNTPLVLVIMDGWGIAPSNSKNAVSIADTPYLDQLEKNYPSTKINAHGEFVGLPKGQMGNSEVGHLNIGAGRVVKQDLVRINDAINDGSFYKNPSLLKAAKINQGDSGTAHILGLCSPGGVHSSLEHLYALVDFLFSHGLKIFIHAITDGRDTPPSSAGEYLKEIQDKILGKAKISVVIGRFYSMDRDNRWERVEKGYNAHVLGEGQLFDTANDAIKAAYEAGQSDEFIKPKIICPDGTIGKGDKIFFFNFRSDRAREITKALTKREFSGFKRKVFPELSCYICMTEYDNTFDLPVVFPPVSMKNILGEVLSKKNIKQLRCAETEKYAHVTFFFNGGEEKAYAGEQRILIESPRDVETYDQKPEMSAVEVADSVVGAIQNDNYGFVLVNFANGDMVGHTGNLNAAVLAVSMVDSQIGKICEAVKKTGGTVIITADHGNCEKMTDENNEPHTAHTTNKVPLILVSREKTGITLRNKGKLCDVAPTILELLGIEIPREMTGKSLFVNGNGR